MNNNKLSIKTIVAIGIGSAVFMILGRFASIPTPVPNTNLDPAYAFLALMSVIFGPIAGMCIGFIGHTIKDLTFGAPWFSWIIASAVVGLCIGTTCKKLKVSEGVFGKKELLIFNLYQIVANAIAWFIVAPTLDIVIYAEPANKVYLQGAVAGISNIVSVAIIGSILLYTYAKTRVKSGSLSKE